MLPELTSTGRSHDMQWNFNNRLIYMYWVNFVCPVEINNLGSIPTFYIKQISIFKADVISRTSNLLMPAASASASLVGGAGGPVAFNLFNLFSENRFSLGNVYTYNVFTYND